MLLFVSAKELPEADRESSVSNLIRINLVSLI